MYYLFTEIVQLTIILIFLWKRLKIPHRIIFLSLLLILWTNTIEFWITTIIIIGNGILTKNRDIPRYLIRKCYMDSFHFIDNFNKFPKKNSIIVANHPHNLFDYVAFKMLPMKVAIMAGGLHYLVKWTQEKDHWILYNLYKKNNFDEIKNKVKEKIKEMPILMFIENTSKVHMNRNGRLIAPLRHGVFHIAQQLNIPITPMVIDRIDSRFGMIHQQPFRMIVGDTVMVDDVNLVRQQTWRFMQNTKDMMENYK